MIHTCDGAPGSQHVHGTSGNQVTVHTDDLEVLNFL